MESIIGTVACWLFVAGLVFVCLLMVGACIGFWYFNFIQPLIAFLRRDRSLDKPKKPKRTKWTPSRFVLLLSVIMSPCMGFLWPPLGIIMPILGISTWVRVWQNPKYGYTRDWKFDWKNAFTH